MDMHKWSSNSPAFENLVPVADRSQDSDRALVLGMRWLKSDDVLYIKAPKWVTEPDPEEITCRMVIRACAGIYDPCGWIAPTLFKCRQFIQETWKHEGGWDDPLPFDLWKPCWQDILELHRTVEVLQLPRHYADLDPSGH